MYEPILFIHSWFRWLVVLAAFQTIGLSYYGLIKGREWGPRETKALKSFSEVFAYQVGLGLILYLGLSPLTKIAFSDIHFAMKDPILRFWSMEHGTSMLSALSVFHLGRYIALKKRPIEQRFKIISITMTLTIFIILCAIPWPFLKHGRDLFRWFF